MSPRREVGRGVAPQRATAVQGSGLETVLPAPVQAPRPQMVRDETSMKERAVRFRDRIKVRTHDRTDGLFTILVMTICLAGLGTGLFGWRWIVAALAGTIVGLLLAHLTAALRLPLAAVALLALVLYTLLGGPLAIREGLALHVFPKPATMKMLLVGLVGVWKDWLTMLPPVDARGRMLVVPWFLGLVGTLVVHGTARRVARPVAALLPAVGLLVVVLWLGTLTPAAALAQGAVLAALLAAWASIRAGRGRAALLDGAGAASRVATALVMLLLAGTAGWLAAPRTLAPGAQREVARSHVVPPYDVIRYPSPLSGLERYSMIDASRRPTDGSLAGTELFGITGVPADQPVRLATLDTWDGVAWGAADRTAGGSLDPNASFQQVGTRIGGAPVISPAKVQVAVAADAPASVWVPTTGTVRGVRFLGGRQDQLRARAWLSNDTGTLVVPAGLQPGDVYELDVTGSPTPRTDLTGTLDVASGSVPIDASASVVDERVLAWAGTEGTAWQRLGKVAAGMKRDGAWTDAVGAHDAGRIRRFLATKQLRGSDEQYATTFALAANRLGIPARVVVGALPGSGKDLHMRTEGGRQRGSAPGGQVTVRGADVRAWVEVRVVDGSWVPILPQAFTPPRSQRPGGPAEAWQAKGSDARLEQQRQAPPPPAAVAPVRWDDPSTWPPAVRLVALLIALPLLVTLLWLLVVPAARLLRRLAVGRTGPSRARAARAWRLLVIEARALGIDVPRNGTRPEQAAATGVPGAVDLARAVDDQVFGTQEAPPAHVAALAGRVRQLTGQVRGTAPLGRRLRGDLDPTPLLAPTWGSTTRRRRRPSTSVPPTKKATTS